jgi:hypothetical protein
MKKLLTFAVLAIAATQAYAQPAMISNQVVAPAGAYFELPGSDFTLSTTVGDIVIKTVGAGGIILTQGFQQPNLPSDPTKVNTVNAEGIDMLVFPNPFSNQFYAVVNLAKNEKLSFSITDLQGKTVNFEQAVMQGAGKMTYTFNTDNLAQGLYHLTVRNESGSFTKTLKVSKIN